MDDLSAPLRKNSKRNVGNLTAMVPIAIAGLLGLGIAVFVVWAAVVNDPLGGEPVVVVSMDGRGATPKKADEPAAAPKTAEKPEPDTGGGSPVVVTGPANNASGVQTVTIIDGSSGQRQEVAVPSSVRVASIDQRLLESTRHGPVPRIGLDGARASVVYARPAGAPPGNVAVAKVALVMTGLGIGASSTGDAISKLPGPVTFAFVPYGAELERVVSRARSEGHEILLQIPMEPIDFPESDPGPHTLLTSLAPEQNIDRMHWLMSRFQGYVGLANQMGARFTATEQAFAPVLREAAKRGLIYLDDGSSPRSLASQIAGANNLPFAKAGVVIDAVPSQAEIDRALAKLEGLARENGVAVGVASALPLSIDQLAKWAKTAPSRGFHLVPISAVAMKAKSS